MSHQPDRIQSPLGRARALGSAHDGVHHWLIERATAVLAVPLTFWLVWSVTRMPGWTYTDITVWLAQPLNAILMILSVIVMFTHAALGVQVILEDYVHCEASKLASLLTLKFLFFAGAVACIFAILKIALAG